MIRCPRGTEIQSVMFDADTWTATEARGWLLAHQFKAPRVDRGKNYLRYRQRPTSYFTKSSIRTIDLEARKGIRALIGCPKKKTNPKKRSTRKTASKCIPKITAALGQLRELAIERPDSTIAVYKFPVRRAGSSKPMILLSNESGKEIYSLPCPLKNKKLNSVNKPNIKRAINTFEKWSDFKADSVARLNVAKKPLKKYGRVLHIVYRSDKYTGRNTDYIHTFKQPPVFWADKGSRPTQIGISGGRLKITTRGIEG